MSTTQLLIPSTVAEPVTDIYHGTPVVDPYRWLEDHQSPRTREWIAEQSRYARALLDSLPGRDLLRKRITGLFDVGGISEIQKSGERYFFTMRNPGEEQASIYLRESFGGEDKRILDPADLGEGNTASVTIVDVSPDGRLLAYGVRTGGQGARRVRILEIDTGKSLPDELPKGALRGFSFLQNSNGFLYVTEEVGKAAQPKAAKVHILDREFSRDKTVFYGGRSEHLRLVSGLDRASGIATHITIRANAGAVSQTYYLQNLSTCGNPIMALVEDCSDQYDFRIHGEWLYFCTDVQAPNRRILRTPLNAPDIEKAELVLAEGPRRIQGWHIFGDRLLVTTVEDLASAVRIYFLEGQLVGKLETPERGTIGILAGDDAEFLYSFETYTRPATVYRFAFASGANEPFQSGSVHQTEFEVRRSSYRSTDGREIPITILGKPETFHGGAAPTLLTAYGAAGVSLTPRYSPLANCLVELGGLFAIANIRGGGELGEAWHQAGTRRNRPVVDRDFLAAAEYLMDQGFAARGRLAIAGGSNSGLLVGTAMTQRPDLFCAVLCVAPFLDMLRYHRFDNTQFYIPQFGVSADPDDFRILLSYSPYHNIHEGTQYPALFMVSGDADTRCDPMHARKFVARIQAAMANLPDANREERPVLLDWNPLRGHFATLPLSVRIDAIVDRLAFLCHQLGMEVADA
jgi:prolyl oligopeptidase